MAQIATTLPNQYQFDSAIPKNEGQARDFLTTGCCSPFSDRPINIFFLILQPPEHHILNLAHAAFSSHICPVIHL